MQRLAVIGLAVALLAGCAVERAPRYYSEYKVAGLPQELPSGQAELVHIALANAKFQRTSEEYDKPLRLLSAPQPAMSPADTDARVTGKVIVRLVFSELGTVESAAILESTKDSLAEVVLQAVRQWRLAPATTDGKPVKVVVKQAFSFKTDW